VRLVLKDQPCPCPCSEVCFCRLPSAFSNVSSFACGSCKLPAQGFPCLSCHHDRSVFAGNLMKAKPGRVLYLARVDVWLHICTSLFGQKRDVLLWRKPKIHLEKKSCLYFYREDESPPCCMWFFFHFCSMKVWAISYSVQMPWHVLIALCMMPFRSSSRSVGTGSAAAPGCEAALP